jgi:hypothetical protein
MKLGTANIFVFVEFERPLEMFQRRRKRVIGVKLGDGTSTRAGHARFCGGLKSFRVHECFLDPRKWLGIIHARSEETN